MKGTHWPDCMKDSVLVEDMVKRNTMFLKKWRCSLIEFLLVYLLMLCLCTQSWRNKSQLDETKCNLLDHKCGELAHKLKTTYKNKMHSQKSIDSELDSLSHMIPIIFHSKYICGMQLMGQTSVFQLRNVIFVLVFLTAAMEETDSFYWVVHLVYNFCNL